MNPPIGHRILRFESLPSTNDYAKTAAFTTADHGTVILAEHQMAGRGQYGRTWASRPGESVLMSVVVFPSPTIRRPVLLTAWAALAVCRTVVELTGRTPSIKWPNDVLVEGKKLSGILIEQVSVGEQPPRVVVGIGVNVGQTAADFTAAGLPEATSLSMLCDNYPDRDIVAARILSNLAQSYQDLTVGRTVPLERDWIDALGVLDNAIRLSTTDGRCIDGRIRELSFTSIEVETEASVLRFEPESVRNIQSLIRQ